MNLSRLKKLSGLNETITNDPQLNAKIESGIDKMTDLSSDERTQVLDALEILMDAPNGLTSNEWRDKLIQLHGKSINARKILQSVTQYFKNVLFVKVGEKPHETNVDAGNEVKKWKWKPAKVKVRNVPIQNAPPTPRPQEDDSDIDALPAHFKAAVASQVGLTSKTLNIIKAMRSFTAEQLVEELVEQTGNPEQIMEMFVDHFLQHFRSMLITNPDGTLSLKKETEDTRDGTMQGFRNIVDKGMKGDASGLPDDEEEY